MLDASIAVCILILCWLFALAFFFQRYRSVQRRRRAQPDSFYPTSASLGNALQNLQIFAQPQVEHILQQKLEEEAEEDDSGGPDDPTAHLRREAGRIRRGQSRDRLKIRI